MAHKVSPYVSPFGKGLVQGQTDQGTDWSGAGKLYAIGDAIIERVSPQGSATGWPGAGWSNTGAMIVYRLVNGPRKGQHVYLAENVDPVRGLKEGQRVKAGTQIATARGASPWLETGWAANASGTTLAQQQYGGPIPSSVRHAPGGTAAGRNFVKFIQGLTGRGQSSPAVGGSAGAGVGSATERTIVNRAAQKYNVNPDVLWGIYGAESSWGKAKSNFGLIVTYPGDGTSGDFTTDAFKSAEILRDLLNKTGGSYEKALRLYSGGGYGLAHIRALMGGGDAAAGTLAPFGRSRPGGGDVNGAGGAVGSGIGSTAGDALTAYVQMVDSTDNFPDPIGVIKDAIGAVGSVLDFLKWIAWLFHPVNILRAVEFVTGIIIMSAGLHSMVQSYITPPSADQVRSVGRGANQLLNKTPIGTARAKRQARRSGRETVRAQRRSRELQEQRQMGARHESRKNINKGSRKLSRRDREDIPF